MSTQTVITIIGILEFILVFFVGSAVMLGVAKMFKISQATYKKMLLLTLSLIVVNLVLTFIERFIPLNYVSAILFLLFNLIINLFVFYSLFKKWYQINLMKTIGIYIIYIIVIVVISIIPIMIGSIWGAEKIWNFILSNTNSMHIQLPSMQSTTK